MVLGAAAGHAAAGISLMRGTVLLRTRLQRSCRYRRTLLTHVILLLVVQDEAAHDEAAAEQDVWDSTIPVEPSPASYIPTRGASRKQLAGATFRQMTPSIRTIRSTIASPTGRKPQGKRVTTGPARLWGHAKRGSVDQTEQMLLLHHMSDSQAMSDYGEQQDTPRLGTRSRSLAPETLQQSPRRATAEPALSPDAMDVGDSHTDDHFSEQFIQGRVERHSAGDLDR